MTLRNRLAWVDSRAAAGAPSGFGKGIDPCHLRLSEQDAVHVSLAGDWAGIARSFHALGDVFASTLNEAAILTQAGRFPPLQLCPGGRFATNGCGGLGFDFGEWRRLWATRRTTAGGVCRSLAVVGHDDTAAHQIVLAASADEARFAQFARRFQGTPERRSRQDDRPCAARPCAGYHERFQRHKREFVEAPDSGARRLDATALVALFEAALAARLRLSTTIVSAPAIQSSLWTPDTLERREGQITVTAPSTQLRLQPVKVAEIWAVPLPAETGGGAAVELYDAQDRLLLGVAAAPGHKRAAGAILSSLPVL
jgi:putative heme degradation protein